MTLLAKNSLTYAATMAAVCAIFAFPGCGGDTEDLSAQTQENVMAPPMTGPGASSKDPVPETSSDAPKRSEICEPLPPSGPTVFVPPDKDCEMKTCGTNCDPCIGAENCVEPTTPYACSIAKKCIEVEE